jgi:hypothetical protein
MAAGGLPRLRGDERSATAKLTDSLFAKLLVEDADNEDPS